MLKIAALALAASATTASPALVSKAPWWEKVTVTIAADGQAQSCRYESNMRNAASESCQVEGSATAASSVGNAKDSYTRITFERRFSPGSQPDSGALQTGDTLLGRQVLALAIDGGGAVKGCTVVASSGSVTPAYGCADASAERFEAAAKQSAEVAPTRGFMTVLVYGHEEHVV